MKKVFLCLFLIVLLVGCASSEYVYSFNSANGLNLFLRPVVLKAKAIKNLFVSMDITVPSDKSVLSGDGTLNYSISFPIGETALYQNADLLFEVGSTTILSKNRELLFLDAKGNKKQVIRYTSSLDRDEVELLVKNSSLVSCSLKTETAVYPLDEADLQKVLLMMSSYLL